MKSKDRINILGVGFDNFSMSEAVAEAMALISRHGSAWAVTPNPEIVMLCRENAALAEAARNAALVIPDGIGVIFGAKILGTPLKGKLPGIDFASALMDELAKSSGSIYLFGAKPGVAEKAAQTLLAEHPGIRVVGTHDGYFTDDAPIIAEIQAANPDLLLVCLGAPKQELWMQANAEKLHVGMMIGLGGSLDVFAGEVRRAPKLWQMLGLEWLYRLLKEPKRIGRMMKLPAFLLAVIGQKIRGKNKK